MGIKRALDILEPFERDLEREIDELRHKSNQFEITDDDSKSQIETKEFEQKYLQEIEHQAEVLKNAIRELKSSTTQKRPHKRKSPLTLGY
jgi:TATA-binding protein-associated factor Taf7